MDRISRLATLPRLAGLLVVAMLLDGCSGSAAQVTGNSATSSSPTGTAQSTSPTPPSTSGTVLTIGGSPAASVTAGNTYYFQPTVSAGTGTVTFSITGQPAWASFNTATGALTGTPSAGQLGTTGSIAITATDGSSRAYLAPFTIQVTAAVAGSPPPTGSATLSWTQPTHNTDGTPITNLAGYHIYYGTNEANPSQRIDLSGATATTYVVQGLAPGTYYFMVVAYNDAGIDSPDSNVAVKTI